MIRKPIQIAMSPYGDGIETVALCNDGTMWQLTGHQQWVEMPPIPQDESNDPLAKLYAKNVDQAERLGVMSGVIDDVRALAERMSTSTSHQQQRQATLLFDALGAFAEPQQA